MKYIFKTLCGCEQVIDLGFIETPLHIQTHWKLPLIDPDESAKLIHMKNKDALHATIATRLFKRVGEFTFREVANQ